MRRVTPEEMKAYTDLLNEAEVVRGKATLKFQEIRRACGAPLGWAFDEESGEWMRPQQGPNGVTFSKPPEKFEKKLRAVFREKRKK